MDLVVPDKQKTIREGAIAPWNTPAYSHERDELVALAKDYELPIDVPFAELTDDHRRLISEGVPEREFGGLRGFFRLAGKAQVQNARPRVSQPLAQLSPLPGMRRRAAASRGIGRARGGQEYRRDLCPAGRRGRTLRAAITAIRMGARRRSHDARTSAGAARVLAHGGPRLPDARPHAANPVGRRVASAWR